MSRPIVEHESYMKGYMRERKVIGEEFLSARIDSVSFKITGAKEFEFHKAFAFGSNAPGSCMTFNPPAEVIFE